MLQVVEQTKAEKVAMYMKVPKKKLIEMLLQCQLLLENIERPYFDYKTNQYGEIQEETSHY